jgi:hypothetical protein
MSAQKEVLHNFDFEKKRFAFKFFLQTPLYQYFTQQPKAYRAGVADWETHYWNMFINDDADKAWMDDILAKLSKMTSNDEEKVMIACTYVQEGLAYDWARYSNAGGMQYPYETVYRGMGLCGDKAMLLTKILCKLGFKVAMLTYNKANHMALAIQVPKGYGNYVNRDQSYAFIESTSQCQIGHIPEQFVGGISLTEIPKFIFPTQNGTRTFNRIVELKKQQAEWTAKYGKNYLSSNAYEKILLEEMYFLDEEMKRLNAQQNDPLKQFLRFFLPFLGNNVAEYNSLVKKRNNRADAYNKSINQRMNKSA